MTLAALGAGCSTAEEGVESGALAATTVESAPAKTLHLIPASPVVARACASELATTYCDEEAAARAAATCADRLSGAECRGPCTAIREAKDVGACHAGATYPTAAACRTPVMEDCSFYRTCLETSLPCGEEGYALGFGERLCYAFVARDARFSAEGRAWLREVRPCLQRALVPSLEDKPACEEEYDRAMSSHVACYTDEAHSICELPLGDVVELARVLGRELFTLRALRQMRTIGLTCARRAIAHALGIDDEVATRRDFFEGLANAAADGPRLDAWLAERSGHSP